MGSKSDSTIVNVVQIPSFLPPRRLWHRQHRQNLGTEFPHFAQKSTNDYKAYASGEIDDLIRGLPQLQGVNRIELAFDPSTLMIYLG